MEKIKILKIYEKLKKDLESVDNKLNETLKNQIEPGFWFDIAKSDSLKNVIAKAKKDFLKNKINIDEFIKILNINFSNEGYELGYQVATDFLELENQKTQIERKLKKLEKSIL